MVALTEQLAFDYGDMPAEDAKALERHAESVLKITERQRRSGVENALKLGEELKAAQDRLSNHGNGTFGKWCKERLGMSRDTAYRLITIHERVPEKDCCIVQQSFDLTALYKLLADTAPEEAYRDALKLAKKGTPVRAKDAKEIIAKYVVEADDSDPVPDSESESEAEADPFQPADFVMETRKYVRGWVNRCPPDDLHFVIEALRDLAEQLERKTNGD